MAPRLRELLHVPSVAPGAMLGILAAASANATGTLDQEFDPFPSNLYSYVSFTDKAQTFTVGLRGQLVQVDISISRDPETLTPLLMDLRVADNGVPAEDDSVTLASMTLSPNQIPTTEGFVSVDISGFSVLVEPGDVLAIVLHAVNAVDSYTWYGRWGNPYPRGNGYVRSHAPGERWRLLGADDHGFRTYVSEPVAVEATTWGAIKSVFNRISLDRWSGPPVAATGAAR